MKQVTIPLNAVWAIVVSLCGGSITLGTMVWNQAQFQQKVILKLDQFDKSQAVMEKLLSESEDTKVFKQFILIRVNQIDGDISIIKKKVDGLYGYSLVKKRKKDD
jgi:hypothetical protein